VATGSNVGDVFLVAGLTGLDENRMACLRVLSGNRQWWGRGAGWGGELYTGWVRLGGCWGLTTQGQQNELKIVSW